MITKPTKTLVFPLLLVLYEISTYLSNDMYLPALPQMMVDLHLTLPQAQLTLTSWFIGQASMPLVMGAIADRYGRRPVLLLGGVIYIIATILCAVTHDTSVLLIARFIEGSMVASMLVPGYASIHELYEQTDAIRILALMGSITVLAPAFGPLLGGIVLAIADWRVIFWFIAALAVIALLLLHKWMPETLPRGERKSIHLAELFNHYWQILSNKRFMTLMMILGFDFAGFVAWITAGPILIIDTCHYSAIQFGLIQAGIFIAYIIGSHCVKHILQRLGVDRTIILGLATTMIGSIAMLACAYIAPSSLYLFLASMTLYSLGSAFSFAPLNRLVIEASDRPMGVRMAFFMVCFSGAAALGSALSSVFFDGSITSLTYIIAGANIMACLLRVLLK